MEKLEKEEVGLVVTIETKNTVIFCGEFAHHFQLIQSAKKAIDVSFNEYLQAHESFAI
jgi:hypothetical protein